MIREGTISDIPEIIRIGKILRRKTLSYHVPVDRQSVYRCLQVFISNPDRLLLVAEHDGKLTGFLMMGCESFWWDCPVRGRRYATDWAFYSQRQGDGKDMLERGIAWAWTRPRVVDVTLGTQIPNHMEETKELYEAAGLKQIGMMFYKENPLLSGGDDE